MCFFRVCQVSLSRVLLLRDAKAMHEQRHSSTAWMKSKSVGSKRKGQQNSVRRQRGNGTNIKLHGQRGRWEEERLAEQPEQQRRTEGQQERLCGQRMQQDETGAASFSTQGAQEIAKIWAGCRAENLEQVKSEWNKRQGENTETGKQGDV